MNSVQLISVQTKFQYYKTLIFVVFVLWFPLKPRAQAEPGAYIKKIVSEINFAKNDSIKIVKLSELAFYYNDYLGEKRLADSTSQAAIDLAETTYKPGLQFLAYNLYIECNDPGANLEKSLRYAQQAIRMSNLINIPKSEWRSYNNLTKVYLAGYQYEKALGSSYQALAIADAIKNEVLKAESYLLIGQSLEGNNQKIEAFRNYLNATALAEITNNQRLIKSCYSLLSGFYNYNKLFDKAVVYKLKQLDILTKSRPVDSIELMWARYDLQAININSNNNKLNVASMQEVLDFAIRKNHTRLKNYEIALYRSHLIEAEQIGQLNTLYNKQYPAELRRLSMDNPSLYFRLKAYFNEADHKPDSAYYYLVKAEQLLQTDPNKIMQSNFYQRFGQFLVRQGKSKEAVVKFIKSYELAHEASYMGYMLNASKSLESAYAGLKDFKNAYSYSVLNRALTDSINILTKNDQILMLEIDHESHLREHAAEEEHQQVHRRHNIQYTAITIVIIAMFILLMMLGSLKVPAWTIKMLGFFSFILFFEFIIMIADHKIYEITANEPWKILLIKIGLIAFLLPFHHWIEKKVIHFLIEHKLINFSELTPVKVLRKHLFKGMQKQTED